MYLPTSLLIFGLSKAAPALLRKTGYFSKADLHRRALCSLKSDALLEAIRYNRESRRRCPTYEKALILHDILKMRVDSEAQKISAEITSFESLSKVVEDKLHGVNARLAELYSRKPTSAHRFVLRCGIYGSALFVFLNRMLLLDGILSIFCILAAVFGCGILFSRKSLELRKLKEEDREILWKKRKSLDAKRKYARNALQKFYEENYSVMQLQRSLSGGE